MERVLPRLAERVLEAGGRLLVVSADAAQRAALDACLWTYRRDSFLPHAEAGTGDETEQPVLLSGEPDATNAAATIALADGRWRDEALGFDRTLHLFGDEGLDAARTAWRGLAGRGVRRAYWRQEDGRWTRIAGDEG